MYNKDEMAIRSNTANAVQIIHLISFTCWIACLCSIDSDLWYLGIEQVIYEFFNVENLP